MITTIQTNFFHPSIVLRIGMWTFGRPNVHDWADWATEPQGFGVATLKGSHQEVGAPESIEMGSSSKGILMTLIWLVVNILLIMVNIWLILMVIIWLMMVNINLVGG